MNLVERVKNIILSPKSEWEVIKPEKTDTVEFYKSYIVILAAIGPVAGLIGMSMFGISMGPFGTFRVPLGTAITSAIVSYALSLVGVYLVALIINALAGTFSGKADTMQALKVIAYAWTPAWVGGFLQVIPMLGMLSILLALYGLYVLYLGLPVLMEAPKEKALGYTAVVIVCAFIVFVIIGLISASFITMPAMNIPIPQGLGG